jgi:general secretion pathway protein A
LFFEHYRLETNPFERDGVRPVFHSHSTRMTLLKLDELLAGGVHCLFLSGPSGVGKSTVVGRRLDEADTGEMSWVGPGLDTREALLSRLIADLGPGDLDGNSAELRNILEVFLTHQAAKGERAVVVADGLESLSVPVLRELESLAQLRYKYRPLLQMVMITRNEDLVANLLPRAESMRFARAVHQRLAGFTLEETGEYLRACLRGAGGDWPEALFPTEVVIDIQGFTRGLVGDINAICREALNSLAARPVTDDHPPRVTRAMLKEAGARLHLRYDVNVWEQAEGALSPDAVRLSDPGALNIEAARLVVTSAGKVVKEIQLDRPRIVLGRDRTCDISLDSSYVSRYQNLFMDTGQGWLLIDLNSSNGCFVNGQRVREHQLHDGDLIAVGQHQLRFHCAADHGRATTTASAELSGRRSRAVDTLVSPAPVVGKRA